MRFPLSIASLLLAVCYGCSQEINLGDYRDEEGKDMLTLNSIVNPDSVIEAVVTDTYFFSDLHHSPTFNPRQTIDIWVNGQSIERMRYDQQRNRYTSGVRPAPGDIVELRTNHKGVEVVAKDTIPQAVQLGEIMVEQAGPISIYTSKDYLFTYHIELVDDTNEENYYFLQFENASTAYSSMIGVRDFTQEFVFQQLAREVNKRMPGWEPYSPYGLPFSDKGINGRKHTLTVREIVQGDSYLLRLSTAQRRFKLYAISKSYYQYLLNVLQNSDLNTAMSGGMIDLGISEPAKVYSNISGGVGILGSYNLVVKQISFQVSARP
ncbi:MAG: DUF4249 domain-containing protein [Bacteroidaceae bacterium]|nr:DUF4249 domain-containing protein [Bacteroidaceae bacterium]